MRAMISIFAALVVLKAALFIIMRRLSQIDLSCVIHLCVLLLLVYAQVSPILKLMRHSLFCNKTQVAGLPLGKLRSKNSERRRSLRV